MIVNGREYTLWGQFVEKKEEFIGGTLQEMMPGIFKSGVSPDNIICDIQLYPNGEDSAYFEVVGEKYNCGADVQFLGITAGEEGWITFQGYGGHTWRIKQQEK